MTVEQHLHCFLLQFFGVDAPSRLGMEAFALTVEAEKLQPARAVGPGPSAV
jgi:hypothetical protein